MLYANRVWGRPVTWPKCYTPNMSRKWTILNRYISVNTNFDEKWFVIFKHTINLLSFGYVRLPQPKYYFPFFFLVFFFLFRLSTFKPLNALYSKFKRLKISGRTSGATEIGGARSMHPPQSGSPNFWSFKPLQLNGSNFWRGQILKIN